MTWIDHHPGVLGLAVLPAMLIAWLLIRRWSPVDDYEEDD